MAKREVPHPDIDGLSNGAITVTNLEVVLGSNQKSILLGLRASGTNAAWNTYALAPPAAARLAQDLQRAVDEYLYGASDEETG